MADRFRIDYSFSSTSLTLLFSNLYFLFDFSQNAILYKLKSKNYKLIKVRSHLLTLLLIAPSIFISSADSCIKD